MADVTTPKCACPQSDARACYRFRYGIDLIEMIDAVEVDDDGECPCGCHEGDGFDDDFDEQDESAGAR